MADNEKTKISVDSLKHVAGGWRYGQIYPFCKALGFGGSVPYAFFVFGEMFRTMLRLRPYKSCDAESVVM